MTQTVLIVDDGSSHLRMAEYAINHKFGYHAVTVGSREEALRWIRSARQPQPDLVLIDVEQPDASGWQIVRDIKSSHSQLPVIALVPYGDDDCAGQAVQAGVSDFLSKPMALDRLKLSLLNTLALTRMSNALQCLEHKASGHVSFSDLVGRSQVMQHMLRQAGAAAATKLPIWIEGEAGTGKELLARAIHGSSDRAGRPFVTVDCKMLSGDTAEAILFGQERNTEASNPRLHFILGKMREAEKGTLFLKEIGSLPPELQHRLLEMLHEGTIKPLLSAAAIASDVRIIVSSVRPVKPLLAAGTFSHMLYRRFHEPAIHVPPLGSRTEDIALLAKHFIISHAASENRSMIGVSEEAQRHLAGRSWPGNIRQLSRLMWQAVMICNQDILDSGNLRLIEQWQPVYYKDYDESALSAASPALFDGAGRMKKLKSIEEEVIRMALHQHKGCMTQAARQLGIGRSTLYRRVNDLGIDGYISRANQETRPMITASAGERS